MTRDGCRAGLRRAAARGDWMRAERLGRAYGPMLAARGLEAGLALALGWLARRWPGARPRQPSGR